MCKKLLPIVLIFISGISCSKNENLLNPPKPVIPTEKLKGKIPVDLNRTYDVVIYGGTMAGIIAALEIKSSGKSVIIVNPPQTSIGGMTANGLGITDVLNTDLLWGLTRKFYQDIKKYYNNQSSWFYGKPFDYARYHYNGDVMIWFEPRAAISVINQYILDNEIPILYNERLLLDKEIVKDENGAISYLEMESGVKIKGNVYIDATYEGDIMAKAGVSYTIGREGNEVYGERSNGVQLLAKFDRNEIPDGINAQIENIESNIGSHGSGDERIQAYCYRMCLTNVPANRVAFTKPIGYNEREYYLLFEYIKYYKGKTFFDLMPLPNGKTDSNNFGAVSTDYVGENYKYPDGNYQEREIITQKHKNYQMGLLWTLANHPNIPLEIRQFYQKWGLAKDEFQDNGNWPKQLYIREGRRMLSEYVMTENNCIGKIKAEKAVGMGDYPMDSHIVRRFRDGRGFIKNEGQVMAAVRNPYPIDYRSIIPRKEDCSNLFVPICLSASHIAYASIRMEPVFMSLGQSSAVAAILAIDKNIPVQDIDYSELLMELKNRGIVLK